MPEDASLDAFDSDESADAESADSASATGASGTVESEPETDDSDTIESETDETPAADESPDPDSETPDADPAVSTFDWSPEGGKCADCDASVERRWRADGERGGALVCADCKRW